MKTGSCIQHRAPSKTLLLTMTTTVLCAAFLAGCGHGSLRRSTEEGPRSLSEVLQQDSRKVRTPVKVVSGSDITIRGVKLKNTRFDYPITLNSRVEYWVDYFTGRGRPHFTRYLERSEFFIPYIQPLLRQSNMPEDLVYLAMIESGFNNFARSHAKAVGPWQFISATGKRYGLGVNWWIDERRDIRKSTFAAIEYLRDLYNMFGSWELAAAAYNAGEAKVAKAIRRYGTKDFWVLSRHRYFRPETRDYVPKIIAAALVAKNREQFGFLPSKYRPADDEAIAPDGEIVKVIKSDRPEEKADDHDLQMMQDMRVASSLINQDTDGTDDDDAEDSTSTVALAPAVTPDKSDKVGETVLAKPVPIPHVNKQGEVGGMEIAEFEVQSPADLLKVARAAGLSYQTIKALNPEVSRWCTPPTVNSYRLKLPMNVKDKFLATYNHAAFPRQVQFMTYKVRKGESLNKIARLYGIKVDPISDLNGVSPRMPLRSGVKVLLPIPNDRSRSLASLEVRDPPEKRKYRRSGIKRIKAPKIGSKQRTSARSGVKVYHPDS